MMWLKYIAILLGIGFLYFCYWLNDTSDQERDDIGIDVPRRH
jgi:hypothetical protein